jgi:hypothetical protein
MCSFHKMVIVVITDLLWLLFTSMRFLKGMVVRRYLLGHAHFVEYGNDVPTSFDNDMKPVGALILSLQAVRIFSSFPLPPDNFAHRWSMYSSPRQVNVTAMAQQVSVTSHPTIMETARSRRFKGPVHLRRP